jgi:hypothetical protein
MPSDNDIHKELMPLAGDGPFEPYSDNAAPQPVEPAAYVADDSAGESSELE